MKAGRKRTKLSRAGRKLAGKYIAEEVRTKKYGTKQAVAIGISRAARRMKEIARRHKIKHRR